MAYVRIRQSQWRRRHESKRDPQALLPVHVRNVQEAGAPVFDTTRVGPAGQFGHAGKLGEVGRNECRGFGKTE
jgi:hypothetical protein